MLWEGRRGAPRFGVASGTGGGAANVRLLPIGERGIDADEERDRGQNWKCDSHETGLLIFEALARKLGDLRPRLTNRAAR